MTNGYLTHSIHPYHAKYIPEIPRNFIQKYSKIGDRILDPFCGSGTTLLEAQLLNRKSVGVDLSFLASKISKAKTTAINPLLIMQTQIDLLEKFKSLEEYDSFDFPDKYIWYTKETNEVLDKLLTLINNIDENDIKNIFQVAFSSILKTVSNKRSTWNNGYIADNVLPNMDYTGDALSVFRKKIESYYKKYSELWKHIKYIKNNEVEVFHSDILDFSSEEMFDMVITSPPYPFAVDFVKYNRLSYYWFGEDVIEMAEKETGSRHKRNRKEAISEFFSEMDKIYKHVFSMVKSGGYFCMTVSDTHRNKKRIFFYDWLVELFLSNGWILIESNIRDLENQSMPQKRISQEHMVVFKKL
jgi:hypothetical protein